MLELLIFCYFYFWTPFQSLRLPGGRDHQCSNQYPFSGPSSPCTKPVLFGGSNVPRLKKKLLPCTCSAFFTKRDGHRAVKALDGALGKFRRAGGELAGTLLLSRRGQGWGDCSWVCEATWGTEARAEMSELRNGRCPGHGWYQGCHQEHVYLWTSFLCEIQTNIYPLEVIVICAAHSP